MKIGVRTKDMIIGKHYAISDYMYISAALFQWEIDTAVFKDQYGDIRDSDGMIIWNRNDAPKIFFLKD